MSEFNSGVSEPVVFHSVLIEHFRGFNSATTIPLNASAVVISGANGRGKTSLFDAIQWLVLGRIERLEELRYRKEEHIVNRYAPPGSKAKVVGTIQVDSSSETVTVSRTGDGGSSLLEIQENGTNIMGEEAETWLQTKLAKFDIDREAFTREFLSAGLLQQDVVRQFLLASPAERHKILARMLGVSVVNEFIAKLDESIKEFRAWIIELKKDVDKSRDSVNQLELQIKETVTRIEAAPALIEASEALYNKGRELELSFLVEGHQETQEEMKTESLLIRLKGYSQSLQNLVELVDITHLHFQKKPSEALEQLLKRSSELEADIESKKVSLEINKDTEKNLINKMRETKAKMDNLHQLAALAISFITDHCPVCEQEINSEHVKKHLEEIVADQSELLDMEKTLKEINNNVNEKENDIDKLKEAFNAAVSDINTAEQWQIRSQTLYGEIENLAKNLNSVGYTVPLGDINTFASGLPMFKSWAQLNLARLSDLEIEAGKLRNAQSVTIDHTKLERMKLDLDQLKSQHNEKNDTLDKANRISTERRFVVQIAREKEVEVVDEIFNELQPVVQDLFSRLAPHPTFRTLSIVHELYYGKGTSVPIAIDSLSGIEVNPSIVFSSAQANVAAICYFLALAFSSSTTDFGFVLLDDPLQSMDDVNILGLSDLCRFLRREKQLIVATHDYRLSNLLLRKLTSHEEPFRVLNIDFRSWNSQGPIIKSDWIEVTPVEPILASL